MQLEGQLKEKSDELEATRNKHAARIDEHNRQERDMQIVLLQREEKIAEVCVQKRGNPCCICMMIYICSFRESATLQSDLVRISFALHSDQ